MTLCLCLGTLLCEGSGNSRSYFFRSVPWRKQKNKQTNNFPGLFPAAVFASVVAWRDECTSTTALFFSQKSAASRKAQNGAGHQWAALVGDSLEVRIIKLLKPVTRSC